LTHFKHVFAHGVAELVLQGLVLKVELDLIGLLVGRSILVHNHIKENFNSSLGDGFGLERDREFNLESKKDVLVFTRWSCLTGGCFQWFVQRKLS
jgi:hypothetical protein